MHFKRFMILGASLLLLPLTAALPDGVVKAPPCKKTMNGNWITAAEKVFTFELNGESVWGRPVAIDGKDYFFGEKDPVSIKLPRGGSIQLMLDRGFLKFSVSGEAEVTLSSWPDGEAPNPTLTISRKNAEMITWEFEKYKSVPLDLSKQYNTSFVDDAPGDKTGWTDQGPDNDMSCFKESQIVLPEVTFKTIPAGSSKEKNAIGIGSYFCWFYPESVTVPAPNTTMKTLFLLHAVAWNPGEGIGGNITVEYQDGSRQVIPLDLKTDVCDWHYAAQKDNCKVAWRGDNRSCGVGLLYSTFPLEEKPLKSITFSRGKGASWFLVSAALSPQRVSLAKERAVKIVRNENYRSYKCTEGRVKNGSALDFSFLQDAPAGKYGHIKTVGENFYFEKSDKPVRFYGTNTCLSANFPTHAEADQLADNLARSGYNAVRIHHWDGEIVKHDAENSYTIDEEKLDRLFYFIAALKKRGIYTATDLYCSRHWAKGEFKCFPEMSDLREYKAAVMLYPEIRDNLKKFAKNVFTRVNPYTGMTWGEDPVLISCGIVNEDNIFLLLSGYLLSEEMKERIHRKFTEVNNGRKFATTTERDRKFNEFINGIYLEFQADMIKYLRSLGIKAPLCDLNHGTNPVEWALAYEIVDKHNYSGEPSFGPQPWWIGGSSWFSSLNSNCIGGIQRIADRPFIVSEFSYGFPNQTRAEEAIAAGAIPAMQNIGAMYHFCYSHNNAPAPFIDIFDSLRDPVKWFSERLAALMFLRGDVAREEKTFVIVLPREQYSQETGGIPAGLMSFFGKCVAVMHVGNGKFVPELPRDTVAVYAMDPSLKRSEVNVPVFYDDTKEGLLRSLKKSGVIRPDMLTDDLNAYATFGGQIRVNRKQSSACVITDKTEAMTAAEGSIVTGKLLQTDFLKSFALTAVTALDDTPLMKSDRMLILHVTDIQMEGLKYTSRARDFCFFTNGLPVAKYGKAEITLNRNFSPDFKLWALNFEGERVAQVPFEIRNGKLTFTADTFACPNQVVFAYELTRK